MTITPAIMYWFTRLDVLNTFFMFVTIMGGFGVLFLVIGYYGTSLNDCSESDREVHGIMGRILKWAAPLWTLCLIGTLFVPTSKQMAMIYVVPALTESQVIKQDIPELYDLGIDALKNWLKKDTDESGDSNHA